MLYHLLAPLARQHIIFNLFNYITFRAAGATVTALLLAFIVGPWVIEKLREHRIGQIVRAEGPTSHHGKRGTPTMGGLIILLATIVPTLLWARLDSRYVIVTVVAVGWYLDWYKVHSLPAPAGHRHLTIDINTVKIGADLHKGEQNLQKMLEDSGKPQAIGSAKAPPAETDKKGPGTGARAEHPEGATARKGAPAASAR